jgi:hypothetical protein
MRHASGVAPEKGYSAPLIEYLSSVCKRSSVDHTATHSSDLQMCPGTDKERVVDAHKKMSGKTTYPAILEKRESKSYEAEA